MQHIKEFVLNYCFPGELYPYVSNQNSLCIEQYTLISTYSFPALHKSSHIPNHLGDNGSVCSSNAK